MSSSKYFDVIVIGAGHAGCEAALASARCGAKTLLVTMNCDNIAQMSCNPAVGGIAKGQVVREIDALGGAQGIVAEAAAIQFRMLNRTKGPAVYSPRAQCDKVIYRQAMKLLIEESENLSLLQAEATGFDMENSRITGIVTQLGEHIKSSAVVVTTGTFLHGLLHYGMVHYPGGRAGDFPSDRLSEALSGQLNLRLGRLKTGTPPRLIASSIDFSKMTPQPSERGDEKFSFWDKKLIPDLPQAVRREMPCHMVYSTDKTAEIVREHLHESPMYSGVIKGIGTRYCPSFEDKIMRFPQHPRHLLFLEPEGAQTGEYYLNGMSSSLPIYVQEEMVHSIPGLEKAQIMRYAYAIEYDFVYPDQTERSLQNKLHPNLFTAGQINGTSGYEEAAGQGLIAGMNAARFAAGREPLTLSRNNSYIGVMLDDLATKEIVEPYRLFTSRAEYRLSIRQDNADLRLCDFAREAGLLPENKYLAFKKLRDDFELAKKLSKERKQGGKTLFSLLKNSFDPDGEMPFDWDKELPELAGAEQLPRIKKLLAVEAHYDGYLQREELNIKKMKQLDVLIIPDDFDYNLIPGLSNESRQKLLKIHPADLSQASRIDGVTPSDIALIQVFLTRKKQTKNVK